MNAGGGETSIPAPRKRFGLNSQGLGNASSSIKHHPRSAITSTPPSPCSLHEKAQGEYPSSLGDGAAVGETEGPSGDARQRERSHGRESLNLQQRRLRER